jgi:UMF1 family MFS transporter
MPSTKTPKKKVILLTKKELWSWYCYDFANSVYSSGAIGVFLPILTLTLAQMKTCPYHYATPNQGSDDPNWPEWPYMHPYNPQRAPVQMDKWTAPFGNLNMTSDKLNTTCVPAEKEPYVGYAMTPECTQSRGSGKNQLPKDQAPFCSSNPHAATPTKRSSPFTHSCTRTTGAVLSVYDPSLRYVRNSQFDLVPADRVLNSTTYGGSTTLIGAGVTPVSVDDRDPLTTQYQWSACFGADTSSAGCDANHGMDLVNGEIRLKFSTYKEQPLFTNSWDAKLASLGTSGSGDMKVYAKAKDGKTYWSMTSGETGKVTKEKSGSFEFTQNAGQPNGTFSITNIPWRIGSATVIVTAEYYATTSDSNPTKAANYSFTLNVRRTTCVNKGWVYFAGAPYRPAALASAQILYSVLLQIASFCSVASFGDFGGMRKVLMLFFAVLGSTFTMAFYAMDAPDDFDLCTWIAIWSNVFFGSSIVMYNAYLPFLIKDHPEVRQMLAEKKKASDVVNHYKKVMDSSSGIGMIWGYFSGFFLLAVGFGLLLVIESSLDMIRLIMFLVGAWWLLFTIPCALWINPRPGPPLPGTSCGYLGYTWFGWERIGTSLKTIFMIPETIKFMICYFFYSDSYNAIANVGIIFAREELNITFVGIALLAFIIPAFAGIGIIFWLWVQRRWKVSTRDMVVYQLAFLASILVWGGLGNIPGQTVIGLFSTTELYIFCICYGFVLGAVQSYSRTLFVDLIPPGQESEFFGLFEISDKGSSFIGPLVVVICLNFLGSIRPAIIYLLIAIVLPMNTLRSLGVEKAKMDCASLKMAMRIKALKAERAGRQARSDRSFLSIGSSMRNMISGRSSIMSSSASSIIMSSQASELQSAASSMQSQSSSASVTSEMDDAIVESAYEDDSDEEGSGDEGEGETSNYKTKMREMMAAKRRASNGGALSDAQKKELAKEDEKSVEKAGVVSPETSD